MTQEIHLFETDEPNIVVVDSSKMTRMLIIKTIREELPNSKVTGFNTAAEAIEACQDTVFDLVTTALVLPDMNGFELAGEIREQSPQRYIPIILISGSVDERLEQREISEDITDYFDKSNGFKALGTFVKGYVQPDVSVIGHILYVEDSRVVAVATRRILESQGMGVTHVVSVEEALDLINNVGNDGDPFKPDLILSDVYLKGGLTGKELVKELRAKVGHSKREMPIIVMTGDDNKEHQKELIGSGANDLVEKPINEHLLIKKIRFQMQLSRGQ